MGVRINKTLVEAIDNLRLDEYREGGKVAVGICKTVMPK